VLDRKVALKTVYAVADPKEVEAEGRRFLAESRISASLPKHPHIVNVYEAGGDRRQTVPSRWSSSRASR
jgi:hypothetical protein